MDRDFLRAQFTNHPLGFAYDFLFALAEELHQLPAQLLHETAKGFGHRERARRPHDDLNGGFPGCIDGVGAGAQCGDFSREMFACPGEQASRLLQLCDGGRARSCRGQKLPQRRGNRGWLWRLQGLQNFSESLGGLLAPLWKRFKPIQRGVAGVERGGSLVIRTEQFTGLGVLTAHADARCHETLRTRGAQQCLRHLIEQQAFMVGAAASLAGEDAHLTRSHESCQRVGPASAAILNDVRNARQRELAADGLSRHHFVRTQRYIRACRLFHRILQTQQQYAVGKPLQSDIAGQCPQRIETHSSAADNLA